MLYRNNIFSFIKRHSCVWLLCLFCLLGAGFRAQVNFVVDPSFEIYDTCNQNMWLYGAKFWHSLDSTINTPSSITPYPCTPIYCNTCSNYLESSLPHNYLFGAGNDSYRYPRSGNGVYVVGYYESSLIAPIGNRNFLRGHLYAKLVAGKQYCGKFYVSPHKQCQYGTDRIGAYLDNGNLDLNSPCIPIIITPAFENPIGNIITDTTGWTKVQGVFTANGNETYITIGNFYSDANSHSTLYIPSGAKNDAELYTDDVSIIAIEIKADGGPDQTLCISDSITLGRPQEIGLECQWYLLGNPVPFSNNSDFTFKATQTGTYTFVQRMDNCAITFDTVNITVIQDCSKLAEIPNVFTPNEDGQNDAWEFTLKDATNLTYTIYNRWGNLVYQPERKNIATVLWDGRTSSGEKCSEGTYFYVITYFDYAGQAQKKKGQITLFR